MADHTGPVVRSAGKRGKRTPRHVPELRIENFTTDTPAPEDPLPSSYEAALGIPQDGWGMLGNDVYGDCVEAATEHIRMADAFDVTTGSFESGFVVPTTALTERVYFDYGLAEGEPGPDPDEGTCIADWLAFAFRNRMIEGYAEIPTDIDSIRRYALQFRCVLLGLELPDEAEEQFESGQCWSVSASNEPDPNEGHGVAFIGWSTTNDFVVTWGEKWCCAPDFLPACVDEAWVIDTNRLFEQNGYDKHKLVETIRSLNGSSVSSVPLAPARSTEDDPLVGFAKALEQFAIRFATAASRLVERLEAK